MKRFFHENDRPGLQENLKALVDISPDGRIEAIRALVSSDVEERIVRRALEPLGQDSSKAVNFGNGVWGVPRT